MFKPRPKQQEVLDYTGGMMGVAAVPGSGKTATLSYLAAQLVAQTDLEDGQEILIVTLVNSAVSNFARQVNEYINQEGLLPGFGYRVRTLHGLANDIVRQKPTVAQVDENFTIVDDRESNEILQDAVEAWTRKNPLAPDDYLANEYLDNNYYRTHYWSQSVTIMAGNFIRQAKDYMLSPDDIRRAIEKYGKGELLLAQMCNEIYADYERGLNYRGAVDFQDLIRLALQVLQNDELYLKSLQHKWVYILEDEAQDSSKLQEDILRMLAGENQNWVRVGDPNQAIFETFTTANPKYLRDFINADDVLGRELPNSGRSTKSIQKLANQLIKWSLKHPHEAIREWMPLSEPLIQPTPKGDPQPNPKDNKRSVILHPETFNPTQEALRVVDSIANWLPDHQDETVAILVPRNTRGSELVQLLKNKDIPYVENLNSTSSTRAVVGSLTRILNYLADPKDAGKLASVYQVWLRDFRDDPEASAGIDSVMRELKKIRHVEDYVVPRLSDWMDENLTEDNTTLQNQLLRFREIVSQWLRAAELPIDQLILTVAGDIFTEAGDIATAYMVALHLQRQHDIHPEMRLPEYAEELKDIAMNKRKFAGLGDDDSRFDPDAHKGKVTVTTMHKAKGLEWDRVYLLSVNNYDFPSADPNDSYMGERWFIRDNLNLAEEALAQLRVLQTGEDYKEGDATFASRIEYAAERLRLLYVGITRARKELIITWNTGRGEATEATPLVALRTFWEKELKK